MAGFPAAWAASPRWASNQQSSFYITPFIRHNARPAVGGLVGGIVRNGLGPNHSPKRLATDVLGGLAVGVLVYLLAPLLIALSLKPAGLENGSKIFEAFFWGFFGGGSGIALLGKIFSNRGAQGATV
jgi:hypothetical protein